MRHGSAIFFSVVTLGVSAIALALSPGFSTSRLSFHGLGPLRVGMTIRDAERAGLKVAVDDPDSNPGECAEARLADRKNVRLLIEQHRITRIEIHDREFLSVSGAAVGD